MRKRARRLQDITYPLDLEGGFGDVVAPRHGGPSVKYNYLSEGRKFLREVVSFLGLTAKVRINPAGPASPGDVSVDAKLTDEDVLYLSLFHLEHKTTLMWRFGHQAYASDGVNIWIEDPDMTAASVAESIKRSLQERHEPKSSRDDEDCHHKSDGPKI